MKNLLFCLIMLCCCRFIATGETISLGNDTLKLQWKKVGNGYVFHRMMTRWNDTVSDDNQGGGAVQTILFSETYPDETSVDTFYIENKFAYWKENIKPVMLNSCGERETFNLLRLVSRQPLVFAADGKFGTINTCWKIRGNEIFVSQVFEAAKSGYYSVSTPALFSLPKEEIHRAVVPGCLNADRVSNDFPRAYTYGHYIPHIPVIYQDKCVTTPTAILSGKNATVAIIPEPEYPRKPHNATGNTHHQWCVGYSTVNLQGKVSPTLYYPVLGREKSLMKPGDKLQFDYRYIVSDKKWFDVFKQVVYNIYGFKQTNIMQNRQALIDRVLKMYRYLTNTKTSRFRLSEFEGIVIGAHDYMGGVAGSDQDAMKNSDYGAMWMLGSLTKDTALLKNVLPYARNFKIKQEYSDNGPFKGAVKGQYYLWKSKSWVEEWGPHIEPMGVTYYASSDLGNILLFNLIQYILYKVRMKKVLLSSKEILLNF
ncbi:MAG: hypothetical protein LBC40_04570, partial [Dysgonamonadaceae bacterium]|nr:hypothetical protein [Dysgonamonadaceae bacterium]